MKISRHRVNLEGHEFLCWSSDETGWSFAEFLARDGRLERLESELVDGHAEGGEFGFVSSQQVVVRLADAREFVLEIFDGAVLGVEDVLELARDDAERRWVEIRGGEDFVELRVLLLERVGQLDDFALEHQLLEVRFLDDFLDSFDEARMKSVAFLKIWHKIMFLTSAGKLTNKLSD